MAVLSGRVARSIALTRCWIEVMLRWVRLELLQVITFDYGRLKFSRSCTSADPLSLDGLMTVMNLFGLIANDRLRNSGAWLA